MFYVSPLLTCKFVLLMAQHNGSSAGTFSVHVLSITHLYLHIY